MVPAAGALVWLRGGGIKERGRLIEFSRPLLFAGMGVVTLRIYNLMLIFPEGHRPDQKGMM